MREIKFRVCTIDRMFYIVNGGEYQLIFGIGGINWSLWDEEGEICNSSEPGTKIMQYTGLKDKNGKEIYEGDIILDHDTDTKSVVEFDDKNAQYYLNMGLGSSFLVGNLEVIGNVYEMPDWDF